MFAIRLYNLCKRSCSFLRALLIFRNTGENTRACMHVLQTCFVLNKPYWMGAPFTCDLSLRWNHLTRPSVIISEYCTWLFHGLSGLQVLKIDCWPRLVSSLSHSATVTLNSGFLSIRCPLMRILPKQLNQEMFRFSFSCLYVAHYWRRIRINKITCDKLLGPLSL